MEQHCCCSIGKSLSRVRLCNSHGLQHARLPCPSLSHGVCPDSCSLSWYCYLTMSSSVVPFSSCLQSFPTSGSFLMSHLFTSESPKYWSFSFSISPSNEYSGLIPFRIDWFDFLNLAHAIKIRNIKALALTHQRHTLQLYLFPEQRERV